MRKLLILSILLTGCATSPFSGLRGTPSAPQKMASWNQTSKPVFMGTDYKGQAIVGYENNYSASSNEITPAKTLGQKIGGFFASLTIFGILFVVICLLTVGGAPLLWIWSKFLKARSALKKTIAGIEELNEADQTKVKDELTKTQDTSDKIYIADLKSELRKEEIIK